MTSETLWSYLQSHHRIHGTLPRLREVAEHFDGKLLGVLMALGELPDATKAEVKRMVAEGRRRRATTTEAT